MDSLLGLHFYAYDFQAIKADEHACTLVVTDIPLFITDTLLHVPSFIIAILFVAIPIYLNFIVQQILPLNPYKKRKFGICPEKYGKCSENFRSTGALQNLDSTWGIFCGEHCLRICPAIFSPDQHTERRTYVALLAGLPHGTIAIDLAEIANEVFAKSINIPFSMNSYNLKPYAYCHFASEIAIENAKSISCALKNVGLTWHSPDEVISLCHQCGHPNCNHD
ncbi:hypothetical protein RhiirC2_788059 [Rhizophagus irregularis]|uniref:RRM domain-containing protein n=1 Tax=Rhizophagus irregularis TaxID=588596 RepID=A0A2N1MQW9_9GLOM|nr:hypothetical protein RhiirC2_788059 [Rhizophagus irregularis]